SSLISGERRRCCSPTGELDPSGARHPRPHLAHFADGTIRAFLLPETSAVLPPGLPLTPERLTGRQGPAPVVPTNLPAVSQGQPGEAKWSGNLENSIKAQAAERRSLHHLHRPRETQG